MWRSKIIKNVEIAPLNVIIITINGDYQQLNNTSVLQVIKLRLVSMISVTAPSVVVGVVGIGHVPGIIANWSKDQDIKDIVT